MDIKKNLFRFLNVNWPVTIFVNFYYFNFLKAIRLPILIGHKTKIGNLGDRGSIEIQPIFGQLCFGLKGGPFNMGGPGNYLHIGKKAKIKIEGTCRLGKGVRIKVFDNAVLQIGNSLTSNANMIISCMNSVTIGNDCLVGWNVSILDNDGGHSIQNCKTNEITNIPRPVSIGNHVWLASNTSILKGVQLPNNSVLGYGSILIGKSFVNEGCVIAGNPPQEVKACCTWRH